MRFNQSAALLLVGFTLASCESKKASPESANPPAVAPEARDTTQAEAMAPLPPGVQSFGERITEDGAVPIADLPKLLADKDSVKVKLVAQIADVCQVKGCWMDLPQADGKPMKVRFKEYAFFVPKDAKGRTTVVQGWAKKTTTAVDELRHYAEDAHKSKAEIAAITKPVQEVAFEAEGVLIK